MATMANGNGSSLLLLGTPDGVPVIPAHGELTRLNYFDGKFLRAVDLTAEQDYLRRLIQFGNQAGGSGVVAGYDTVRSTSGDAIDVSPGIAIDGQGRILQLPVAQRLDAGPLIAASNAAQTSAMASAEGAADFADCVVPASGPSLVSAQTADLYLLSVGYTEALCGEENVYGKLCEDACAKDVDRRWRVEGVIFRARPLGLVTPLVTSKAVLLEAKHLRSRAASAYYADERARVPSLISGAGLRADTWCLGASAELGGDVPLAVFSRSGGGIHFVDAWIARRERMEAPPRRYWAWRMSMRPWPAYLAQILQFQCELHDIFTDGGGPTPVDPCAPAKTALSQASVLLARLETFHADLADNLSTIRNQLPESLKLSLFSGGLTEIGAVKKAVLAAAAGGVASDRVLIDGGFVELPPAGYLPVTAGATETVNSQVRRLVGPGLDLRFCIVRPDYIPHALEMRQHMERISLLDGLADVKSRPEVDILVPNGRATQSVSRATGQEFRVQVPTLLIRPGSFGSALLATGISLEGAARWTGKDSARGDTSGGELVLAISMVANSAAPLAVTPPAMATTPAGTAAPVATVAPVATAGAAPQSAAAYALLSFDADPFAASIGNSITLVASIDSATVSFESASFRGTFTVRDVSNEAGTGAIQVKGQLQGLYGTDSDDPKSSKSGGSLVLDLVLAKRLSGVQTIITAREARSFEMLQWTWDDSRQTGTLSQILPTLVGAELAATNSNRTLAVLEEQDDVLETPNRWNDDVVRALDTIEPRTNEPTAWRTAANAKLWPAPPSGSALDVLATLDWVLFCRRRTESCNHEVAPNPPKRFQVWAIEIGAADWNDAVKAKLIADPAAFQPQQVDVVEFESQGYALGDGSGAITRWLAFNKKPYNQVLWAGIGMKTSPDPDSLELNRATAYESVLSSTGMTIASTREVLATLPPPLAVPGADGSILLVVTVKKIEASPRYAIFERAAESLDDVFQLSGKAAGLSTDAQPPLAGAARDKLLNEVSAQIKAEMDTKKVTLVDIVDFSPTVVATELTRLKGRWPVERGIVDAYVLSSPPEGDAEKRSRVTPVLGVLPLARPGVGVLLIPEVLPPLEQNGTIGSMLLVTVSLAVSASQAVFITSTTSNVFVGVSDKKIVSLAAKEWSVAPSKRRLAFLGDVTFQGPSVTVSAGDATKVNAGWKAANSGVEAAKVWVFHRPTDAATKDQHLQRAKSILTSISDVQTPFEVVGIEVLPTDPMPFDKPNASDSPVQILISAAAQVQ